MKHRYPGQEKLFRVAVMCQNAIQNQRDRERREGYGVDDYTEGRIIGAANLARGILRVLCGDRTDLASDVKRSRRAAM